MALSVTGDMYRFGFACDLRQRNTWPRFLRGAVRAMKDARSHEGREGTCKPPLCMDVSAIITQREQGLAETEVCV